MIVFKSYSLDMATKRKKYSAKMKFEVVLALISWRMTQAEITSEYGVHATQQSTRKQQFMRQGSNLFVDQREKANQERNHEKVVSKLHETIGQLTVERDWLEKKIGRFSSL